MKDLFIVVPTYNPDEEIMSSFIKDLQKEFTNILIINDGSEKRHEAFFKNLESSKIEVITHYKNMGKGRALKTAFNHLLNKYSKLIGVVTCDCDGQHSVKDIKRCAETLVKNPEKLVLGVRDFNKENVPFKSRYGNKITCNIFQNLIGLKISDTQTGLRGIGKDLMVNFMDLPGERYEYENNMLIACKKFDISITEIVIETIYINSNEGSHFNPLKDAFRIYRTFAKNIFLLILAYIIDILIFKKLFVTTNLVLAVIVARVIATAIYDMLNMKLLLKKMKLNFYIRYYLLKIVELLIDVFLIVNIAKLNVSIILVKILIDFILWLIFMIIKGKVLFYERKKK